MPQILLFFYSTGAINRVYGCLALGLLIILGVPILKNRTIRLNALRCPSFWMMFLFGTMYFLIGAWSEQGLLYYLVNPLIAFTCGYSILDYSRDDMDKVFFVTILAILLGNGLHAALNFSINLDKERHLLIDFFSGEIRAATGSGTINTLIFTCVVPLLITEKSRIVKLLVIALFTISLLYGFILGTRTQFIILIISWLILTALYNTEKGKKKENRRFIFTVLIVMTALVLAYQNNFLGIHTFVEESNLLWRFDDDTSSADEYRFLAIGLGLNSLVEYPFGNEAYPRYFHNLWLDIGRVGGLIPFFMMVMCHLIIVIHAVRIFKDRNNDMKTRYLVLATYLGMMINMSTEPVLEGMLEFFYTFCLINGMTECYYIISRRKKKEESL